ncbi:MAG: ABC transporter ATP-binding protein [Deltaproteobacteria bacterium]|nr:ABC transporter ATP-binding protein [Deltaproteobacteria bacterium]
MLELTNLSKTYTLGQQRIVAVNRIHLVVEQGEFLAILGKSGCGKTTLLSLIGGLDRAIHGRIVVNGRDISQLPEKDLTAYRRHEVGIVFQFFNLLPILTVAENVALPCVLQGLPPDNTEQRVEKLLTEVGLWQRRRHYPHEISGGEMQRVAIARALIHKPSLVLADEPTGNLDSSTGQQILELMAELRQRHNITIILATHSKDAIEHASRVLYMRDGVLLQQEDGC